MFLLQILEKMLLKFSRNIKSYIYLIKFIPLQLFLESRDILKIFLNKKTYDPKKLFILEMNPEI